MLYHFELQMAGVILLTAMAAGAVSLWLKRRCDRASEGASQDVQDGATGTLGVDAGPDSNR